MTTRGRILYCRKCGSGYGSIGEIPAKCPACDRVTTWSTMPIGADDAPTVPYALSYNDRKFLHAVRILADDPDPDAAA